MFAEPLEDDEAVIFIFNTPDKYSFWNQNVSFDLSLAFLDEDSRIVDFVDLNKNDSTMKSPKSSKVRYVVEARKDAFKDNDIKIGDRIWYKDRELQVFKETK
jgi:uncharacterized membrane protein (UPF0127 family)